MADVMFVPTTCPHCKGKSLITVPFDGYLRWKRGELIQDALPNLSIEDREKLITGYDQQCWDALFKPEEE